ncbi:uncharacterized protein LOC123444212 isoform X2 [Hordeum vulgare subsp. vulgare]|uniref:uncharacterized protein LOC123444212 isoform X2 n=1 Tax=Hordeum vulgare subsp. vulgare TaxID=112509 RepID=UPI001D1A3A56|nr:uncharacterized protein LOC123444212 isoform X2 [Hordeum vulgare subsp. vulgare]
MSPPVLTTVVTGMVLATGTVELVRGAVDAISALAERNCSKCNLKVKIGEMVKHLEDHLDEDEMLYAKDKEAMERKLELMEQLEKRLRDDKADLMHKLETIDNAHKVEKRRLKVEKAELKEELLQAKIKEARLKDLALSEIRIRKEHKVMSKYYRMLRK